MGTRCGMPMAQHPHPRGVGSERVGGKGFGKRRIRVGHRLMMLDAIMLDGLRAHPLTDSASPDEWGRTATGAETQSCDRSE